MSCASTLTICSHVFTEKGVLSALARAVTVTPPNPDALRDPSKAGTPALNVLIMDARTKQGENKFKEMLVANNELINQAYIEVPNYERVIPAILEHGVQVSRRHVTCGLIRCYLSCTCHISTC